MKDAKQYACSATTYCAGNIRLQLSEQPQHANGISTQTDGMIHEIILYVNCVLQIHEETLWSPNDLPAFPLGLTNKSALSKHSYKISSQTSIINISLLTGVTVF
jgi:hypothetical protein